MTVYTLGSRSSNAVYTLVFTISLIVAFVPEIYTYLTENEVPEFLENVSFVQAVSNTPRPAGGPHGLEEMRLTLSLQSVVPLGRLPKNAGETASLAILNFISFSSSQLS